MLAFMCIQILLISYRTRPICNDWQTNPTGITQGPNISLLEHTLCTKYSAHPFQSVVFYISKQIVELLFEIL